jgi:tetratricopeptide (TPR) repeat protein
VYWAVSGGVGAGTASQVEEGSARARAKANYDSGIEKWSQGDRQMAIRDIERATQDDPTFAPAWITLSAYHYQMLDYRKSVLAARRALDLKPDEPQSAYYNLGMSLAEQNDVSGAINALESAIRADSLMAEAYSALGDILTENGRATEALDVLQKGSDVAAVTSPVLPYIYKNQGKALLALGRTEDAILRLRTSLNANPSLAESALLLARAYDSVRQPQLAREQWERFLQLERTDLEAISEAQNRLRQNP